MEKEFKIPIPGTKKNIYAKQYGSLDRPVVVFVHGLTGFMDEHQFYNGARYFDTKGFSSVRFNLYDYPDDARKLVDCTLETHAHDLDLVIDFLKKKGAKKIFAVGHSYGAPTIIFSRQKHLLAIVLWDGTGKFTLDKVYPINEMGVYYLNWGPAFLLGKEMYEEAKKLDWDKVMKGIKVPVKFIWAGKGDLLKEGKRRMKVVSGPKDYAVIKNASHIFAEDGVAEELFKESLKWIKKYV